MKNDFARVHALLFFILFTTINCKKDKLPAEPPVIPEIVSVSFMKSKNSSLLFDIKGELKGDSVFIRHFAGADVSKLVADFVLTNTESYSANGVAQQNGSSSADFSKPTNITLKSKNSGKNYIIKFLDLGIPAIYISTNGLPILNKEDYVSGAYKIVSGTPGTIIHEGALQIRGRGNASWAFPKKPYRIKLENKTALLGMPENKNWAIMANYSDRSLMRNELAFEVSRRLNMAFTSRQRYVDLFLNNEYQGSYNITEHQEVGKNKINIDENNGGFYLEVDGYAKSEPVYFITPKSVPVTVKFPEDDKITAAQKQYIIQYYADFETSLFSENFKDPVSGYRKYLDMESFVNYYLVNEISGNPDMLWSMKMYKKNNDDPKLYTGPAWDFDLAVNNDKRVGDAAQKLMLDHALHIRQWIDRIKQDEGFRQAVKTRWNQIKPALSTIPYYVDSIANLLKFSQQPNFIKWDILTLQNIHQSWYTGVTYDDYVSFLRNYYSNRIQWLDITFNNPAFLIN